MSTSTWVNDTDPAGAGFGELGLEDLRQSRSATAKISSGYFCTLTLECNC